MRVLPLFAGLTFLSVGVAGQMAIVEIEKPQVAKTATQVFADRISSEVRSVRRGQHLAEALAPLIAQGAH